MKLGIAFGMRRGRYSYQTVKEKLFVMSDNETENEQKMKEFAEEYYCNLVEVWQREESKWDKIVFYNLYHFGEREIDEKQLDLYQKF